MPPILHPLSTESRSCVWTALNLAWTKRLDPSLCADTQAREDLLATVSAGLPSFLGPTYIRIWAELDEKALPLEAQLPHLRPVEGIDFCETLRRKISASEPGNA